MPFRKWHLKRQFRKPMNTLSTEKQEWSVFLIFFFFLFSFPLLFFKECESLDLKMPRRWDQSFTTCLMQLRSTCCGSASHFRNPFAQNTWLNRFLHFSCFLEGRLSIWVTIWVLSLFNAFTICPLIRMEITRMHKRWRDYMFKQPTSWWFIILFHCNRRFLLSKCLPQW